MPAASCENCGSRAAEGQPLLPRMRHARRRRPRRDRGRGAAAGRAWRGAGRIRRCAAPVLRRLSGRERRWRRSSAPSARRRATRSSRSPSTRPPASGSTGCAASWPTSWPRGPNAPVCSAKRCTLVTRKGRKRPAGRWQSSTGSSAQRRKRWSEQPQTPWSGFSVRSSRCSRPRSSRRPRRPSRSRSRARRRSRFPFPSRRPSRPSRPARRASPSRPRLRARRRSRSRPLAGRDARRTDEVTRDALSAPVSAPPGPRGRLGDAGERRRREPQAGDRRAAPAGAGEDRVGAAARAHARRRRSPRSTARSARSRRRSASSRRSSLPLERDLELHKEKLDRLTELFQVQTSRFHFYRSEYRTLLERLEQPTGRHLRERRAELARGAVQLRRASPT